MSAILDFLFGKDAKVFDETGRVRHHFPDKKWNEWNDRFRANSAYDWRQHIAQEEVMKAKTPETKKSP